MYEHKYNLYRKRNNGTFHECLKYCYVIFTAKMALYYNVARSQEDHESNHEKKYYINEILRKKIIFHKRDNHSSATVYQIYLYDIVSFCAENIKEDTLVLKIDGQDILM